MARKKGEDGGGMVDLNASIPADLHRRLGQAKYGTDKPIKELVSEALDKFLTDIGYPPKAPAEEKAKPRKS